MGKKSFFLNSWAAVKCLVWMSCLAWKENVMEERDRDFFVSLDKWLNCKSFLLLQLMLVFSHFCKGPMENISLNKPFRFQSLDYSLYFKCGAEEGFKTLPIILWNSALQSFMKMLLQLFGVFSSYMSPFPDREDTFSVTIELFKIFHYPFLLSLFKILQ